MKPRGAWTLVFYISARGAVTHATATVGSGSRHVSLEARWVDAARREARTFLAKYAADFPHLAALDPKLRYEEPIE